MSQQAYSIVFTSCLLLLFLWAAWEAKDFQKLARYFPLTMTILSAILCILNLFFELKRLMASRPGEQTPFKVDKSVLKYLSWMVAYLVVILLFGFEWGTALFLFGFLKFETGYSLLKSLMAVAITLGCIFLIGKAMNLYWPEGVIG